VTAATDMAALYLGVQEVSGPNDGPILKTIREALLYRGAPPCSWCALFVAWILIKAHCPLPGSPGPAHKIWLRNTLGWPNLVYVESTRSWLACADKAAMLTTEPCAGDLFILLDHAGEAHHIGFVTENVAPLFHTIEGNTNAGGSVNGDGVYKRIRAFEPTTRFISLPGALKA